MAKLVKLKNGATLLYKKRRMKCVSVAAGFVYGENRNNYSEPTAHFCEHMLFQETTKHNKEELKILAQQTFSSNYNAFTETSSLFFQFLRANEMFEKAMELSSEMLLETKFSPQLVKNEKGVIQQELVGGLNNPQKQYYFTTQENIGNKYAYKTAVLGSGEEISQIKAKDLQKFRDEVFISQNFIISMVGDISLFKAKHLANKYFVSKLKSNLSYPVNREIDVFVEKPGNLCVNYFPLNKVKGSVSFKFPVLDEKRFQIVNMMCYLLTGIGGDFFELLRSKGLSYHCRVCINKYTDRNFLLFEFDCSTENVNKIIDQIGKLIHKLKTEKFDETRLDFIKNDVEYRKKEKTKNKFDESQKLLHSYLYDGTKYFTKKANNRVKKLFNSVTADDILNLSKEIFSTPENVYVAILTGQKDNDYYSYEKIQKIVTGKSSAKSKSEPVKNLKQQKNNKQSKNNKKGK